MTEDDALAVAGLRVRGWRAAYTGIVPPAYLDAMNVEADAERHRLRLARPRPGAAQLVAEEHGTLLGWAAFGPYRGEAGTSAPGELYALYVEPDRIGTGVGRALLGHVHTRAVRAGFDSLLLWVVEANHQARRFYELAGYAPDGAEEPEEYDGVPVPELRYLRSLP